ncbi:MAG: hypothetical protein ACM3SR_18255 [Ignavibacteriales bacterium]
MMQTLEIVTKEMLERLASLKIEEPKQEHKTAGSHKALDIEKWLTDHNLIVKNKKLWQNATIYILAACPFNCEHKQGESFITQFPNGGVAFRCFHNSCQGYNWHTLRDRLEPGWREKHDKHRNQEKAEDLDNARRTVSGLAERAKTDKGAPFEPEIIKALFIIREGDPALFARLRDELKKAGVSLRELDRVLRKQTKSETGPDGEDTNEDTNKGIYSVIDNVIHQRKITKDGLIVLPLCNFDARIRAEKTVDNGAERKTVFTISGVQGGRHLPQIQITADRFSSMNWVTPEWGGKAIVFAGFGTKDHLRAAIQVLSGGYEHIRAFGHLGWRKIGGRWYFLHCGGGISEDGLNSEILVELPISSSTYAHLGNYILPTPPNGVDLSQAVQASLSILNVAPKAIMYPVMSCVYRAILSEAAPVDFSIFVSGQTGSQKTELTAIAQAHYGAGFHAKSLPGNWSSTENALEKQSFLIKDSIFTIDDFAPNGTTLEVQRLHQKADRIHRGQGNRAGRERMRSDGRFQPEYFPRGLIMASGEDIPRGQSLRSRMLIVEVARGDVDLQKLTRAQEDADNGLFAQTMSGYLQWLAPQIEELKKILPARQRELRTEARKSGSVHDRTPDIVASLATGWETFLLFAEDSEAITADDADQLWEKCWLVLNQIAKMQSGQILSEEPTRRFLDVLASALSSGSAHLADAETNGVPDMEVAQNLGWRERGRDQYGNPEWNAIGKRIGWLEGEAVFLDPESSFAVVQELARQQGTSLSITQRTMWKRLDEKGLLASRESSQNRLTIRREIGGARKRVIHLKTQALLGYKTGPSGPNGPEGENPEDLGQRSSGPFPQRRKNCGPQSGPSERENKKTDHEANPESTANGPDNTENGLHTTEEPASGPPWTTEKEEAARTKGHNASEKNTSGPNGPNGPLFGEDPPPGFSNINEGSIGHGEFCDCTECCPSVDPWKRQ